MKSTLLVKDLALDKALGGEAMAAVRGGVGNQANSGMFSNLASMFAPVAVGNGSFFGGPTIIQVDSLPSQNVSNRSISESYRNVPGVPMDEGYPDP